MLQQIVVNTPVWVWAILAFLLYRGFLASIDRDVTLKRVFLIPLVMLVLSLQGSVSAFGPGALPVWLASMMAVAALAWLRFDSDSARPDPVRGVVRMRGSWMPMALMMGIFCTKYVVAVTLAMTPLLKQQPLFAAAVCALYGAFSGIFIGKALRTAALYRQTMAMVATNQVV